MPRLDDHVMRGGEDGACLAAEREALRHRQPGRHRLFREAALVVQAQNQVGRHGQQPHALGQQRR